MSLQRKTIPTRNVLSVDVEDYFQVEAFASRISYQSWDTFESRIERNVNRVLELFEKHGAVGTFFILGWVAQRFPHLVRDIAAKGHEIGCHGFAHQHLRRLTPEQLREDLRAARNSLMNETQQAICCYRAPSFSIVRETLWALEILAEEGFKFDSSIFPVRHDFYGIPGAERYPHWHQTARGKSIFEFPLSTVRILNNNIGIGGGGYLRFAPYGLTRWALRRTNEKERQPAIIYFHPWEIDPSQPRISGPLRSRLRHYTNLASMEVKIERLLRDFHFTTLSNACVELNAYRSGVARPISAA